MAVVVAPLEGAAAPLRRRGDQVTVPVENWKKVIVGIPWELETNMASGDMGLWLPMQPPPLYSLMACGFPLRTASEVPLARFFNNCVTRFIVVH